MDSVPLNNRILYVDDEVRLLSAFVALMRREDAEVVTLDHAADVERVLQESGPFGVVLSDQRMPDRDGVAVLEAVRRLSPDSVRIMVTGYTDYEDALRGINEAHIHSYITKPWNDDALRILLCNSLLQYNLAVQNRELLGMLAARNESLRQLLEGTVSQTVRLLSDQLASVNPSAAAQVDRVRRLGIALLDILPAVGAEERWDIARALDLCNLGLTLLPAWMQATLHKDGLGAVMRFPAAQTHNLLAAGLLKEISHFENVARIIRLQSKNFDGSGTPAGDHIGGRNLPLGSRLLRILLDLDRLSTATFRGRDVLRMMHKQPGKYDVDIIAAALGMVGMKQPLSCGERNVLVEELESGMVLACNILTENGQCLLKAGSVITGTAMKLLHQWHEHDPVVQPVVIKAH